jgi:hypothetical protein
VHAEDHHLRPGFPGDDLLGSLDPVELWHADIENGNLRVLFRNKLDGFPSIAGLRHDLKIRLLFEQETQARPNDGVIVSEQNANLGHSEAALTAGYCIRPIRQNADRGIS